MSYNLSQFDEILPRIANAIDVRARLWVAGMLILIVYAAIYWHFIAGMTGYLLIMFIIFVRVAAWWWSAANIFCSRNKLQLYIAGHRNKWNFVGPLYASLKTSHFMELRDYGQYGDSVMALPLRIGDLPLVFVGIHGAVVWYEAGGRLPHIVVDAVKDSATKRSLARYSPLPPLDIKLEGNFPDYFHVYAPEDGEQIAREILTPDRMLTLIDAPGDYNIEMRGNYVRLYAADARLNTRQFENFLSVVESWYEVFKIDRLH